MFLPSQLLTPLSLTLIIVIIIVEQLQSLFRRRRGCGKYNHFVREGVRVDGNTGNDGGIDGSVFQFLFGRGLAQHRQGLHLVQNIPAVEHATKDRVQVVEVRLPFVANEELGAIRIGAFLHMCVKRVEQKRVLGVDNFRIEVKERTTASGNNNNATLSPTRHTADCHSGSTIIRDDAHCLFYLCWPWRGRRADRECCWGGIRLERRCHPRSIPLPCCPSFPPYLPPES